MHSQCSCRPPKWSQWLPPHLHECWPAWPMGDCRNDSWLPHLGHQRHSGFCQLVSWIACSGDTSSLWTGSRPPAISRHHPASPVRDSPWRGILQPRLSHQMTVAPADIQAAISMATTSPNHPANPRLNSWPTDTFAVLSPLRFEVICHAAIDN